jgi:hypothetical protein
MLGIEDTSVILGSRLTSRSCGTLASLRAPQLQR